MKRTEEKDNTTTDYSIDISISFVSLNCERATNQLNATIQTYMRELHVPRWKWHKRFRRTLGFRNRQQMVIRTQEADRFAGRFSEFGRKYYWGYIKPYQFLKKADTLKRWIISQHYILSYTINQNILVLYITIANTGMPPNVEDFIHLGRNKTKIRLVQEDVNLWQKLASGRDNLYHIFYNAWQVAAWLCFAVIQINRCYNNIMMIMCWL